MCRMQPGEQGSLEKDIRHRAAAKALAVGHSTHTLAEKEAGAREIHSKGVVEA